MGCYCLQFLAIGNIPAKLPETYDCLKSIYLSINFGDLNETLVLLCFLQGSPNLHELVIEDFWEAQGHLDCSMNHLRVVRMTGISGAQLELQFINFLLANSPVLEILSVTPKTGKKVEKIKMLEEFLSFRRASASAEIVIQTSED
ncbi:hypothetical protein HHK36_006876 [Tetracentron sinense]|uniref:FBD domain-containing protein n=1 Tax=Tetracentron sinense TaxID=13715 RepID=A0A834ZIT0_TETSI|nr:hypothetical protein HHK36_006876 [Tetracentron sinense]